MTLVVIALSRCVFFPQRRAFIIWIFPTATLFRLFFTLKSPDTENDRVSYGCYQIVIKGTMPFPLFLYAGFRRFGYYSHSVIFGSVSLPEEDTPYRFAHQAKIQQERGSFYVQRIHQRLVFVIHIISAAHLRKAGKTWSERVYTEPQPHFVACFSRHQRARADQGHIPCQDVPELRQFVKTEPPEKRTHPREIPPWIGQFGC